MSEPVVEVSQGKIKGIVTKNIDGGEYLEFRGIPYAEPPIGNLRFKVKFLVFLFLAFVVERLMINEID